MDTPIGFAESGEDSTPVCIPHGVRAHHVHLIGRPGCGKSSLMERMVLHDVAEGGGVAVLDPDGDLVPGLLNLIPREHAGRVIYADPGDPDLVLGLESTETSGIGYGSGPFRRTNCR